MLEEIIIESWEDFQEKLIEPHKDLLTQPNDDQLLYKVMSVENLVESIKNAYLYFNRVDSYSDFPNTDPHDGEQLPKDRPGNTTSRFIKAPDFSAADSYDLSRKRTYACCLSLENSDYIWNKYGSGGEKGKGCLIFKFGKLRDMLNKTVKNGLAEYNKTRYEQTRLFFINYGTIRYVDWKEHQENQAYLPNPIVYSYFKDNNQFSKEKELRITLSNLGIRKPSVGDNEIIFPENLQVDFNFRTAIANGTIQQILYGHNCDSSFFMDELQKLGIYKTDTELN